MCGIGGYYATRKLTRREQREAADLFADMLVNLEKRGTDAAGMFVVNAKGDISSLKGAGPARLRTERMLEIITEKGGSHPVVVGHTRHATHGSPLVNKNNHPFYAGRLVGVHNGVFAGYHNWAPKLELEGECDSEAIYAMLAKTKSSAGFFEIFDRLNSYNRMVFWDRKDKTLYAYSHNTHGLAFNKVERLGVVYFATAPSFLPKPKGAIWANPKTLYIMTERRNGNGRANQTPTRCPDSP